MGRGRGRSRTQRKHFKDNRENVWKRSRSENNKNNENKDNTHTPWEPFQTQNPSFDEYYKEQGIVGVDEWDTFIQLLRRPLPSAFRINSSSQFCSEIRSQLENDFMKTLQAEDADGVEVEPIRPLPWYPENLAWHSNFSRMQLRKNQNLERFHEFLKLENEIGNITRQEAVSMVPPLFLDVCPDHIVLDMCAAPGSKTFQLLEIIHRSSQPGLLPRGMVVANDVDVQRSNLLIHQTKRMCTANLIVTNHGAQHFPSCRLGKNLANASEIDQLLFDRVLCDVPCSGDGTLRKAPDIWRKWNVGMGNGVHSLQIQIAMRGIALLKVGGRMVYSTCSMNPIENEAVVSEILRRCGGSVELVDVSNELPQLARRPGLKKWKVRDKGTWLTSHKDVPQYRRDGIFPSMFPSGRRYTESTEKDQNSENDDITKNENGSQLTEDPVASANVHDDDEVSSFPLERCMRIVPHDSNTGAFFIAVLQKHSPTPVVQEKPARVRGNSHSRTEEPLDKPTNEVLPDTNGSEADMADGKDEILPEAAPDAADLFDNRVDEEAVLDLDDDDDETSPKKGGKKRKSQNQGKWKGIDPVLFFKDEAVINSIKTYYGIDESFPFNGHLVTRNSDPSHVKRVYYVSKSVKDVLELNLLGGQQLKIASVGLKMFERQSSKEGTSTPCSFRISSEGLPLILPYITKQILVASPTDFKHLLQYKTIKFADFVDAQFGEKASNLMMGCCTVVLNKEEQPQLGPLKVDGSTIAIGCWKGRASLTVMVTEIDCQELRERLLVRIEPENEPTNDMEPENKSTNGEADQITDMQHT